MTAIAYRDGVMAGDGMIASVKSGEVLSLNDVKVFKLDKYLIGVAGDADASWLLVETTRQGINPGKIKAWGIRANKKGRIEHFDGALWYPVYHKYSTEGVGGAVAMAAMDMGADAVTAVRVACKRNAFCGGRIRKVEF